MPAVQTQQLAQIADLQLGPASAAMVQALAMYDAPSMNTYLRRASGTVLAAYAPRFGRALGASFVLANWGDFTISLVVAVARWMMIADRGFNPANPTDKTIRARFDDVTNILDEIVDITNKTPRFDPDATDGTPGYEEEGPLAHSEGGVFDEADHYARPPGFDGFPGGGWR